MVLIALLVVLGLERVAATSHYWQFELYYAQYHKALLTNTDSHLFTSDNHWKLYIWLALPPILVYLILAGINIGVIEVLLNIAGLLILIGCSHQRQTYRKYLDCANRGDTEGSAICAEKLGRNFDDQNDTLGKSLVWINFTHYFGILFWFALLSLPGALVYALAHKLFCRLTDDDKQRLFPVLHVIDWLPARFMSFGLLFVGNFSKALPLWLSYLFDLKTPAKLVITEVATAAEYVEPEDNDCTEEPCVMVRLVKRNILFFLGVISILTLYGWIG